MRSLLALALASTSLVGCLDSGTDAPSVVTTDLNGDTWNTVDDLPYTAGRGADYTGVSVAPNGHVWVVGARTETSFDETWLVRESTNSGASFGFNSDFVYPGGTDAVANGVSIDSAGRVFVAGWGIDGNGTMHWITRRSSDDGASWATVDDWSPTGASASAQTIAVDDNDTIFVGGGGQQANGDTYWKVRFSTDHGATWNQFDFVDQGPNDGIGGSILGVCFNSGDVFSAGSRPIAPNTTGFEVRDSSTGVIKENWVPSSGGAQANGCGGFGGTNPLYVAGQQMPPSLDAHWIVQRSANGGALTTVDDLSDVTDISAAFAVRDGNAGTIYAVGVVGWDWRVRKTTDGTTWVNSDEFSLAEGDSELAQAQALKYSPALEHTFVVGMATDSSGRQHGIVRRR